MPASKTLALGCQTRLISGTAGRALTSSGGALEPTAGWTGSLSLAEQQAAAYLQPSKPLQRRQRVPQAGRAHLGNTATAHTTTTTTRRLGAKRTGPTKHGEPAGKLGRASLVRSRQEVRAGRRSLAGPKTIEARTRPEQLATSHNGPLALAWAHLSSSVRRLGAARLCSVLV